MICFICTQGPHEHCPIHGWTYRHIAFVRGGAKCGPDCKICGHESAGSPLDVGRSTLDVGRSAAEETTDAAQVSLAQARMKRRALLGIIEQALADLHDNAQSIRHWAAAVGLEATVKATDFLIRHDTELAAAFIDYQGACAQRRRAATSAHHHTQPKS